MREPAENRVLIDTDDCRAGEHCCCQNFVSQRHRLLYFAAAVVVVIVDICGFAMS